MKSVDRTHLSGLLDGELAPPEAEQVRRALAEDDLLREEFEHLACLDSELRAQAESYALVQPRVNVPAALRLFRLKISSLPIAALALRIFLKLTPMEIGLILSAVVLILIIGWELGRLVQAADQEFAMISEPLTDIDE